MTNCDYFKDNMCGLFQEKRGCKHSCGDEDRGFCLMQPKFVVHKSIVDGLTTINIPATPKNLPVVGKLLNMLNRMVLDLEDQGFNVDKYNEELELLNDDL